MKSIGNKGTILVEMCVIMPIVVIVVMMAISMMMIQINQSTAVGTLYVTSCNRSAYLSEDGVAEETLAESMKLGVSSYMQFVEDITTEANYKKNAKRYISGFAGTLTMCISYGEMHPGMAFLLKTDQKEKSITVNKQIRSTEDNLRRWQLYGSIL